MTSHPRAPWLVGHPGSSRSRSWLARSLSRAELQADGLAPSWLVWVRACLALHFPGGHPRLCLDRPGLLVGEPGRRLFAILPGPAAKQTHSAAKKTHSVIVGRRLADFSHLGLRRRSAGRSKGVLCLPEAVGRVARLRVPPRCGQRRTTQRKDTGPSPLLGRDPASADRVTVARGCCAWSLLSDPHVRVG